MSYKCELIVWSKIGDCPISKRSGNYCDELARQEIIVSDEIQAETELKKLIRNTKDGFKGCYYIYDYWNNNKKLDYITL